MVSDRKRPAFYVMILLLIASPILSPSVSAAAQDGGESTPRASSTGEGQTAPRFVMKPVGNHPTGYFDDLEVGAGDSLDLAIKIVNIGEIPADLSTYKTNAVNAPNGGFSTGDKTDLPVGLTEWTDYAAQEFQLAPGEERQISFTVNVPRDAVPGQYFTALVVDTSEGLPIPGVDSFKQVLGQATSLSIIVPGDLETRIELGDPFLDPESSWHGLEVPVTNTGNYLIRPAGELTLTNASGKEVLSTSVKMKSVYGGLSTTLSILLPEPLEPGEYTLNLALKDEESGVSAEIKDAEITVPDANGRTFIPIASSSFAR